LSLFLSKQTKKQKKQTIHRSRKKTKENKAFGFVHFIRSQLDLHRLTKKKDDLMTRTSLFASLARLRGVPLLLVCAVSSHRGQAQSDCDTFKQGAALEMGDGTIRVLISDTYTNAIIAIDWQAASDGTLDTSGSDGANGTAFVLSGPGPTDCADPDLGEPKYKWISHCEAFKKSYAPRDSDVGNQVRWSRPKGMSDIPGTNLALVCDVKIGIRVVNAATGATRTVTPITCGSCHSVVADRWRNEPSGELSDVVHIYVSMMESAEKCKPIFSQGVAAVVGWSHVPVEWLTNATDFGADWEARLSWLGQNDSQGATLIASTRSSPYLGVDVGIFGDVHVGLGKDVGKIRSEIGLSIFSGFRDEGTDEPVPGQARGSYRLYKNRSTVHGIRVGTDSRELGIDRANGVLVSRQTSTSPWERRVWCKSNAKRSCFGGLQDCGSTYDHYKTMGKASNGSFKKSDQKSEVYNKFQFRSPHGIFRLPFGSRQEQGTEGLDVIIVQDDGPLEDSLVRVTWMSNSGLPSTLQVQQLHVNYNFNGNGQTLPDQKGDAGGSSCRNGSQCSTVQRRGRRLLHHT
jgi:hypothetical protein